MKYLIFTIISAFLLSKFIFAQSNHSHLIFLHSSDSTKYLLQIGTSYNIFTNNFSQKFINAIIQNKYLSYEIKETNRYKKQNYVFYNWKTFVDYYVKTDSFLKMPNFSWHVAASYDNTFYLSLNKDLLKLALYGNKYFEGEKANLSKSSTLYMRYQTLTIGLSKMFNDNEVRTQAIFDINLHMSNNVQQGIIKSGYLYTAPDGIDLELMAKSQYYMYKEKFWPLASGLSFNITLFWLNKQRLGSALFSIRQFGFWRLPSTTTYTKVDTIIKYNGITLNNIFGNMDYNNNLLNGDTVRTIIENKTDTHFVFLNIPEEINFQYTWSIKHLVIKNITAGISYTFHVYQPYPFIYFSETSMIKKNLYSDIGIFFVQI